VTLANEMFTVTRWPAMPLRFLFCHFFVVIAFEKIIMLHLKKQLKMIDATEKDKIISEDIVKSLNGGKTQGDDIKNEVRNKKSVRKL
jgi:hypothetical protein